MKIVDWHGNKIPEKYTIIAVDIITNEFIAAFSTKEKAKKWKDHNYGSEDDSVVIKKIIVDYYAVDNG